MAVKGKAPSPPAPSPAMRQKLAGIAAAHAAFVARKLAEAPFHPEGRKPNSDYNLHYADLEADDDTFHAAAAKAIGRMEQANRAGSRGRSNHDGTDLHHYWTKDPEGLAKWVESPTPWRTLHEHLAEFIHDKDELDRTTSAWFIDVFGYAAGSDKNRVAHGHPPRGKRVGPG